MGGTSGGGNSSPWVAPDSASAPPDLPHPLPALPFPPQPPPGAPYRPPPPQSSKGGVAIVVSVVAVLAAMAAALFLLDHGDDSPGPDEVGWERRDLAGSPNSIVVSDGERVCSSVEDELFCLDGADGEEVFSLDLPGDASPVALAGDTLVFGVDQGGGRGNVFGYSMDGELLWEASGVGQVDVLQLTRFGSTFPTVGDVVVVPLGTNGADGTAGIDARSGQELWREDEFASSSGLGLSLVGEPVSDGHLLYGSGMLWDNDAVASVGTGVMAVDPRTGTMLWRVELGPESGYTFLRSAVPVADGTAVALGMYGDDSETVVVDTETGTIRWRAPMETEWGGLAHLDGVTVVADGPMLHGYDLEGVELWATRAPSSRPRDADDDFSPELVVAGGRMYVLDIDLVTVDPRSGDAEILVPGHFPADVAATDDYLVAVGQFWVALPL